MAKKARKIGKRHLCLTENRLDRNEIWCAEDNHSIMYHIFAKQFSDSNFNMFNIDKISIFLKIAKFHIFTKIIIF